MPENEKDNLSVQVAELRSDVRHLQSDVTDIKTDLRGLRAEIGSTNQRVDETKDSLISKIDAVNASLASAKLWAIGLVVSQVGSIFYVMGKALKWF